MGYDDKNDLVGVGEANNDSIDACALLPGSKSMTVLAGCCKNTPVNRRQGKVVIGGGYVNDAAGFVLVSLKS